MEKALARIDEEIMHLTEMRDNHGDHVQAYIDMLVEIRNLVTEIEIPF